MPPAPFLPPSADYQHYIYLQEQRQRYQAHPLQQPQNPQYELWKPQGCVLVPLPIHLPHSAPPSHPPQNRLRRYKPYQHNQQQQLPQPQPQPQTHPDRHPQPQVIQSNYSWPAQTQPRSRSRSRPARRESRSQSPPPARVTRSQSLNPRPPTRNRSRSRSRSPNPHGEDPGSRAFLKNIANETIEAINNGIVDASTTQNDTQLFLESSQELKDWRNSHRTPYSTTNTQVLALSTLKGARHLNAHPERLRKIGVLNFASATSPGGGFLNGARAQEESIARSSSLYASLTTDAARPFYRLHAGKGENDGFYTHSMIYSPQVHLFRNDDGSWLHPLSVDVVTSPAVNAGKVRRRYYPSRSLDQKIEAAMHERMARILALFEMKGATSLVLGSFGTGVFQNDVGVVARIWRDLLLRRDSRFKSSFQEVMFCIPDERTRSVFEDALRSRGTGGRRGPYTPDKGGGDVT